ncbi:MAG TPA: TRAP transporter substrate-binding protein [Candidatus Sulfotelmatobacter sp.]|nr:TRAP transporter substrate-binding protein [Candidatus Sulfotelmatobacter sp.]
MQRFLRMALIAAVVLASGRMADAQMKLRFGHTLAASDAQGLSAERFAKNVAERTNNAIKIEVFPAGQLGNDTQVIEGAKFGTIDFAMTGNPFYTSFVPELNAFDLPYLFRDFDHAYKVLDGPIGQDLRRLLENHGLKAIGIVEIGFRNVTNNKRPVKVPEDLKGLKLRTTPNPAHLQAFRLLGANPVPMPITEVYLALKMGTVDGQENPIAHIHDMKFHEVQKYLSLTYHAYTSSIVVMNLKKFQELTPEQQKILQESLQEATNWDRKYNRELDVKALAAMKAAGMQVEENPDREAFRKVVAEPTAAEYVKKFGSGVLDKIRNTR